MESKKKEEEGCLGLGGAVCRGEEGTGEVFCTGEQARKARLCLL
jgi:hypothetical protein